MKKKIVIIGCGFAGISAAKYFFRHKKNIELTVIDKKETFDFLPMLPDVIGRNIPFCFLSQPIKAIAEKLKFSFINDEVKSVDLDKAVVFTIEKEISYDYLLIASGSETNFYGNYQIKKHAYKLDDVLDCTRLLTALRDESLRTFVISGAGYTGIEIATALREFFNKRSLNKRIIIVEKNNSILGTLPQWMKDYARANLKKMGVEVILNTIVNRVEDTGIFLADGTIYDKAILIWVSGVRAPDFFGDINVEKNPQGAKAASNIVKHFNGRKMDKYIPVDLGYIIPMANNQSCGEILGFKVKGFFATMMHFVMCIYRSYSFKNKIGIIKGLLKGGI